MAPPQSRKGSRKPSASITKRNEAKSKKKMMSFMRKLWSPVLTGKKDEVDNLIEAAFSKYPGHPYLYRLKAERYISLMENRQGNQYSPGDEMLFREGFEAAIAACEIAPKEIEFLDFIATSVLECKGAKAVDRVRVARLIRRGMKENTWEISGYDDCPDDFPSDSNKSIKHYQSTLESALDLIKVHNTLELLGRKVKLLDLITGFEVGTLNVLKEKLESFSEEASHFPKLIHIGSRFLAFVENQEQFSPGFKEAFVYEISQLCFPDPYELELQQQQEQEQALPVPDAVLLQQQQEQEQALPVPDAVLVQSTAEEQDSPFRDSIETLHACNFGGEGESKYREGTDVFDAMQSKFFDKGPDETEFEPVEDTITHFADSEKSSYDFSAKQEIQRSAGFGLDRSYSSHSQQQHIPSVSATGTSYGHANNQDASHVSYQSQVQDGGPPSIGLRSGMGGSNDQLTQHYQKLKQPQFHLQQTSAVNQYYRDPNFSLHNTESQNPPDPFGLLGLLSGIRISNPDPTSIALGIDLTTLGLNINSGEDLHKTFVSPWSDGSSKGGPEYCVPECYYAKEAPALHQGYFVKFKVQTLFYIFYRCSSSEFLSYCHDLFDHRNNVKSLSYVFSMPRDKAQLYAANELSARGWFYHKELRMWLTRVQNFEPLVMTDTCEGGSYLCFDPSVWDIVRKDNFLLQYKFMEKWPAVPRQ